MKIKIRESKKLRYLVIFSGLFLLSILSILIFTSCGVNNPFLTHTTNNNSSHKICYVPLDTRPITNDYPVKLANTYGVNVVYPDISLMTWFNDTGDPSTIREWLSKHHDGCDAIVVSAEQLVHGGLIQMRKANVDDGSREAMTSLLRSIKEDHPDIKIYLSNVLMRTSNTVLDDESKVWWEKINEFSSQYYKAYTLEDPAAIATCKQLYAEIPEDVMQTFLEARKTNHKVNRDCIELAKEDVVENLFVYQEDCHTLGIQTVEQIELKDLIEQYRINDKIMMANGTDESGSELMMLAARELDECEDLGVEVMWLYDNKDFTAKYEDRPFKQNLESHMTAMKMKHSTNSDDVLLILPPKANQADASSLSSSDGHIYYSEADLNEITNKILDLENNGKHCYLLDLDYCNGGSIYLLKFLGRIGAVNNLYGYSGWNTACNSLGTLLAQINASHGKEEQSVNSIGNKKLTQERILDDVVYQSHVRDELKTDLTALGENVFNISNVENAQKILEQKFANNSNYISQIFGESVPKYVAKFRWPRTFEIEVAVN